MKPEVKHKKRSTALTSGKFYAAPVTVGSEYVTIKLPKKVAEFLDLNKAEVFWSPINGVIQLSGREPHMVIPMMSVGTDVFIAQES